MKVSLPVEVFRDMVRWAYGACRRPPLGWASASERGEWLTREQHEAEGVALDVWRGVWT